MLTDNCFEYPLGPVSIHLPEGHMLPVYQHHHRLYDRFLPHLVNYLRAGDGVVDVGANCGDTLAAMVVANSKLRFLCIEPDADFFALLRSNIDRLRQVFPDFAVEAVQALVGKNVKAGGLEGQNGSKHAVLGGDLALTPRSLDQLVAGSALSSVRLLKSDVDGFDYDVLTSAVEVLQRDHPVLFFECQLDQLFQKSAFQRCFEDLMGMGYRHIVLFDNFGEFILPCHDAVQIESMLNYLWRQNTGHATRTLYYYDVLAFVEEDADLIGSVLEDYRIVY